MKVNLIFVRPPGRHVAELRVAAEGAVVLQPVKPCLRCTIPDVDPAAAERGTAVADTLQAYRRSALLDGAVTFGMNAIVRAGDGQMLRAGQAVAGRWNFQGAACHRCAAARSQLAAVRGRCGVEGVARHRRDAEGHRAA